MTERAVWGLCESLFYKVATSGKWVVEVPYCKFEYIFGHLALNWGPCGFSHIEKNNYTLRLFKYLYKILHEHYFTFRRMKYVSGRTGPSEPGGLGGGAEALNNLQYHPNIILSSSINSANFTEGAFSRNIKGVVSKNLIAPKSPSPHLIRSPPPTINFIPTGLTFLFLPKLIVGFCPSCNRLDILRDNDLQTYSCFLLFVFGHPVMHINETKCHTLVRLTSLIHFRLFLKLWTWEIWHRKVNSVERGKSSSSVCCIALVIAVNSSFMEGTTEELHRKYKEVKFLRSIGLMQYQVRPITALWIRVCVSTS